MGRGMSGKKKLLIATGLCLFAVGVSVITWRILVSKRASKPTASTQTIENAKPGTSNTDVPDAASTKEYENGQLALKFDYPDTWKITEGENKDGVRVESPDFSYKTTDKGTVTGNFRIYIRKGAREADSKYIGRGVAIDSSQKLTYTKPTPGQRTDTMLSQFGLDKPDNFAFFLIAGNFNLKKGDTLGPNYGKEFDTYIIAGGYSGTDQADDLATHTVSTESFQQTNAYKQAVEILKSIQVR